MDNFSAQNSQYVTPEPLAKLARCLVGRRKKAIEARKRQGLDEVFRKAREQYLGVDDLNRPAKLEGAPTLEGPLTPFPLSTRENRSTVFVNITRPYTNAGTARVADIYLPTNKQPWQLKRTPVSDLETLKAIMVQYPEAAQLALQASPELAQQLVEQPDAEAAMAAAELLIKDWFAETNWTGEMRKVIEEAGQVGTGVLKGPFPVKRKLNPAIEAFVAALPPDVAAETEISLKYRPACEMVKVENCFPDPKCGTDPHKGEMFFERIPDITKVMLEEYAEDDSYFADEIALCLEEGPKDPLGKQVDREKKAFDLWVGTGWIEVEPNEDGKEGVEEEKKEKRFAVVTLCNDRVIKIAEDLLGKDCLNYDFFVWSVRENSWAGIGVPEKLETPQRGLNASVRALMDNMGYSVGPQVLKIQGLIEPEDGNPEMYPYKHMLVKLDGITGTNIDDVKKAISLLEFPSYLERILPVIQFWLKEAEDTAELPLILQGQADVQQVGTNQQMQNNATTNIRMLVKRLDDEVTEKQVNRFYYWSQLYGPPACKGDAVGEAIGSSVLLTRELQQQALIQLLDRVVQPVYGVSPKKTMAAILEGLQLDPTKLALDQEEEQMLQDAANKPDPKVEAAQIQSQTQKEIADLNAAVEQLKLQINAGMKGVEIQHGKDVAETQAQANLAQEEMKQHGAHVRELVKTVPKVATLGKKKEGEAPVKEPSVGEALNILGLG
jgi:hypothetical protein